MKPQGCGKENALQAQIATLRAIPLGLGMSPTAFAPRADGNGGDAERKRDIGVSRSAVGSGADPEMEVYGTDCGKHVGVGRQASGRPTSNFPHAVLDFGPCGP